MFKLIAPIAIAALAVISIAPQSQAFPINLNSIILKSSPDSQPRLIVNLGVPQSSYRGDDRWHREADRSSERDARSHRYGDERQNHRDENWGQYRRDR